VSDPKPKLSAAVPEESASRAFRSAGGNEDALLQKYGYRRDEYFIEGKTDAGAYKTRILLVRPVDPARSSGTLVTEIFQTSVWAQVRDYMMRSGHAWAMVSSRGNRWLAMLKAGSPQRYADFQLPPDEINPQILYQSVALLRSADASNPLARPARRVILAGYSGDGAAVRQFIAQHHATARFSDERSVFDGYFVAGTAVGSAPRPIEDIDLPVLEIMNENEMIRSFERGSGSLAYRRADGPRYRLYEIPGAGHITTRGAARASEYARACNESPQSQFPMSHLYSNALDKLVAWVDAGTPPPQAPRIEYLEDGRTIARDEHGNARGGVRSTYLDVPVARYVVVSTRNPAYSGGFNRCEMIAHSVAFDAAKLAGLYGTPAGYAAQVALRADELVRDGWYLAEDAEEIRREALEQTW
jgi:hypothetical protein